MKTCRDCGVTKPVSEFGKLRQWANQSPEARAAGKYLQPRCKPCAAKRSAEWRKKNPERHRASVRSYHVRSRYNLSHEEAEYLESIKKCEICGSVNRLGIDHCHETKKVRGILCNNCNLSLGWANDNIEILEKMIDYLRRNSQ